jgi:transporter family-2 protein
MLKANFWLVAMACGCFQVLQAMSNGSAVQSGIGAIWVGAMSATVSMLTLVLVAVAIDGPPLPDTSLLMIHGWKVVAGGMMGAFIVAGIAFVAPKLGPTQTFILYFFVIAVASALIDSFGLLGTEAKPLQARQLIGVALAGAGLVLARACSVRALKPRASLCGETSRSAGRCSMTRHALPYVS